MEKTNIKLETIFSFHEIVKEEKLFSFFYIEELGIR